MSAIPVRSPAVDHVDDDETIALLRELLHFHTENPPGNEAPAADHLAGHPARPGFQTRCYGGEPGRASLAARLPGRAGRPPRPPTGHPPPRPIAPGWTRAPC